MKPNWLYVVCFLLGIDKGLIDLRRKETKAITPSASTNTGSPKLPTLVECITECQSELDESELGPFAEQCIEVVLNYICRQLRT